MNKEQQQQAFDQFVDQMRNTLLAKGDDYSGKDRLSNFGLAGAICGLSPEKDCLCLIATKVARIGNLLDSGSPKNESIQDSILDLANYTVLLNMIVSERTACG